MSALVERTALSRQVLFARARRHGVEVLYERFGPGRRALIRAADAELLSYPLTPPHKRSPGRPKKVKR